MHPEEPEEARENYLSVSSYSNSKTAPNTPLGCNNRSTHRSPLSRTQSHASEGDIGLGSSYTVASAVTAFKLLPQRQSDQILSHL